MQKVLSYLSLLLSTSRLITSGQEEFELTALTRTANLAGFGAARRTPKATSRDRLLHVCMCMPVVEDTVVKLV